MGTEIITVVVTEVIEQITVNVAGLPRDEITVNVSEAIRGEPGKPGNTYEIGTGEHQVAAGNHDHDVGDLEQLFNNIIV